MRRKYKLFLIIIISALLTYFIYITNYENKIYLVALGDGIASGKTAYDIDGISYNDYLKEYYQVNKILKNYNNSFAKEKYTIKEVLNDLENNVLDNKTNRYLKQIIHKADVITVCFGEDELTNVFLNNDNNKETVKSFLESYDSLLNNLKKLSDAKVVIIGLYENAYLTESTIIILNSELNNLALKYDNIFINIGDLMKNRDYFLNNTSYYFNYNGHEDIFEIIIHSL